MEHLHSPLKITLAQKSDKGPKPENQDTVGARIPDGTALTTKGIAVAIADGVSSSSSAKLASQSAITGFLTDYYATPDTWRTQRSAIQVIQSLNRYLWGQGQNNVREEGLLTTFTSIIFKGDKFFIFHVGDTRVYRFRANTLELLTRDHEQKIDKNTSYLSRALGADPVLEVDMLSEELQTGDIFVLTSDGIHGNIHNNQIRNLINQSRDPEKITQGLMQLAIENNADDNLSAQTVRIDHLGTPSQNDAITVLSQLPFPPPLEIGQSIDDYKVEKIIHESERSQVYIVTNKDGNRLVMKTPSPNYDDDPAYIERFVMESWIGTRIQNTHVVKVLPPHKERTFLYYLTEYIAGPSLATIIKERAPIAIPDAIELVETIIKGVRAFHRKDTLHQDIKPENIIVGSKGPVLIDFGSCFAAGFDEALAHSSRDKILGTLDYSAPEYRYGGKINQASEQFSIAVIFYEMLTGHYPFGEKYRNAMSLKAFQRLSYTPARKYYPLVPHWIDKALEKALNIFPNLRYNCMSELLTDLQRPNPIWLHPNEVPLIEKNPVIFWKIISALGWSGFIALLFKVFYK